MHVLTRLALVALLGLALAPPVGAQDTTDATARLLSKAVITGIHIGAEQEEARGEGNPQTHACVRGLDPMALAPVYQRMLASEFTERERATLDAYYGSPLGELDLRDMINVLRASVGLPSIDPVELTREQDAMRTAFMAKPEAAKLNRITGNNDGEFAKTLQAEVVVLLRPCF